MNKLITFALAISITIPVFSQKVDTHSQSPGTAFQKKESFTDLEKDEYRYDNMGNNTLNLSYMWVGSEWVNIYNKEEFSYDEQGNRTENSIYEGDRETGLVVIRWKAETSYDNTFAFNDLLQPLLPNIMKMTMMMSTTGTRRKGCESTV